MAQAHARAPGLNLSGISSGGLDRRGFLAQAGLGGAGLAALGTLGAGRAQATRRRDRRAGPCAAGARGSRMSAPIARSAAPSPRRCRTASGSARSRAGTARSTAARIAPRAPAVRELVHGDRRLKYPMKLVGGRVAADRAGTRRWTRSPPSCWRSARRPGRTACSGWAAPSSPTRRPTSTASWRAFWGTNTVDHQARICHSTTVAGVANTWGYGAQTNSYNDIRNAKHHDHHGRQPGGGASGLAAARAGAARS